ncbi:MAG: D-alanyl-D-alanine carboxypeptidase [Candidatus Omnitrophica bacterium]|nr:D-alanyl-D-alanine carboxypeptidase [Candidatus Omnitrophota bacterium]
MFFAKRAPILKNTAILRRITLILIFAIVFCSHAGQAWCKTSSSSRKKSRPAVTAQAVYAVDHTKKKVLFSRNARLKFQPASTVKLLTALVVLERIDLNKEVKVGARAAGVQPTKAGLTRGATYSVRELLTVLLASSANDAGVALAEAVSGREADFAVLMNKEARALGCRDSNFMNATGLPNKGQYTTAYDLSIITRAAFNNSFISSVMKKKRVSIDGSDGRVITRDNHNKLLWRIKVPCVLGKTGYTRSAGHCYAGIAYFDDRNVSVVIMKSRKPWADLYAILGIRPKKN